MQKMSNDIRNGLNRKMLLFVVSTNGCVCLNLGGHDDNSKIISCTWRSFFKCYDTFGHAEVATRACAIKELMNNNNPTFFTDEITEILVHIAFYWVELDVSVLNNQTRLDWLYQ